MERGTGNDPATSCLASKHSPTELPRTLVETVGIEPTLAACKTAVLPLNDVPVNFKTNCRCSGRASQTLAPSARASTNLPGRPENEKPLAGGVHRRGSLIFRSFSQILFSGRNLSKPMQVEPIGDAPIRPRNDERPLLAGFGQT